MSKPVCTDKQPHRIVVDFGTKRAADVLFMMGQFFEDNRYATRSTFLVESARLNLVALGYPKKKTRKAA